MKSYIKERVKECAKYIIETNATVRETAKRFDVSKSTIHKDITERLQKIDLDLADKVYKCTQTNKMERHLRGGLITKERYSGKKRKVREEIDY